MGRTRCYKLSDGTYPDEAASVPTDTDPLWDNAACDRTADGYRLPTENEWEYAAKGGNKSQGYEYAGSDDIDEVGWYYVNSGFTTHDVGMKQPNELGIYDMSGNVCEWCDTPFRPYNPDIPTPDPNAMVVRGGYYGSEPYELTVYHRDPMNRNTPAANIGLRLAIRKD